MGTTKHTRDVKRAVVGPLNEIALTMPRSERIKY
jgi:hypothetical protein